MSDPKTPAVETTPLTAKQLRKKFGLAGGRMPCTRLLGFEQTHNFTVPTVTVMILDDVNQTATGANIYGDNLGKGYDPSCYAAPLPAEGDDKWKKWAHKGYEDWTDRIGEFDVLLDIRDQIKPAKTAKPKAETAKS